MKRKKTWCLTMCVTLSAVAALFSSCTKKDDEPQAPNACFTVDATGSTDITHTFVFTNCTGPYNTYHWDFGDSYSSTDLNPTHTYNQIGAFHVTLTATNSSGKSGVNTRTITIGHNSLISITVNKVNSNVNFPKHIYLTYTNVPLGMSYTMDQLVSSASAIPFTIQLADDPLYDNNASSYFNFRENDFAGHTYSSGNFNVSDLSLVNGRIDETFYYSTDSAKFTLQFKIVAR